MTKSQHIVDVFQNNQYIANHGWELKNFKVKERGNIYTLVNPSYYKRYKQPIFKVLRELNFPRKNNSKLYDKLNTIDDLHGCWFHAMTLGKHLRIYIINPLNWVIDFFHVSKYSINHYTGTAHFTGNGSKVYVAQETVMKITDKRINKLNKNATLAENTAHNNELANVVNSLNDEIEKLRAEIRSLKN